MSVGSSVCPDIDRRGSGRLRAIEPNGLDTQTQFAVAGCGHLELLEAQHLGTALFVIRTTLWWSLPGNGGIVGRLGAASRIGGKSQRVAVSVTATL
jgi:hypothetical protein